MCENYREIVGRILYGFFSFVSSSQLFVFLGFSCMGGIETKKKVAGYETQMQCKRTLIAMQAHAQSSRQAGRQTKAKRAGDLRQASKRCLIRQCRISELTTVCREIDRA